MTPLSLAMNFAWQVLSMHMVEKWWYVWMNEGGFRLPNFVYDQADIVGHKNNTIFLTSLRRVCAGCPKNYDTFVTDKLKMNIFPWSRDEIFVYLWCITFDVS